MAGTIKRPHAPVVLDPNAQVQKLTITMLSRFQEFRCMTPVHKNEVNRTGCAESCQKTQARCQEGDELRLAHLSGSHCELSMMNRTFTAYVAINFDVVGRIRKHHVRPASAHQSCECRFLE